MYYDLSRHGCDCIYLNFICISPNETFGNIMVYAVSATLFCNVTKNMLHIYVKCTCA